MLYEVVGKNTAFCNARFRPGGCDRGAAEGDGMLRKPWTWRVEAPRLVDLRVYRPEQCGRIDAFDLITGYTYQPGVGGIQFNGISARGSGGFPRKQMGTCFSDAKPFPGLTVRANIRMGAMFGRPGKRAHEKIVEKDAMATPTAALAERWAGALTATVPQARDCGRCRHGGRAFCSQPPDRVRDYRDGTAAYPRHRT